MTKVALERLIRILSENLEMYVAFVADQRRIIAELTRELRGHDQ